ncbi:S9 family peptidase [Salipaludibacillus daqingensis]|uniref:S9 family peptidase n=1 Tax=Salipaludibacillus daqingensis TaxID=3041001 RepID=UPI002476E40C|nr:S9 family peptidase [Salipaludibacillus daqingensis]
MISFEKPTVEQFFQTYNITNFALNEDESKLLFTSNLNGTMNIWAMNPDKPYPYLFAHSEQASSFLKIDPKNRFVLTGFDHEGDENVHIYGLPYEGGKPKKLIGEDAKDKYFFVDLTEDGERMFYGTSEGNPQCLNTFVYDLQNQTHTLLHEGEGGPNFVTAVSDDEQFMVVIKMYANTFKVGYVKNLKTGELTPLSSAPNEVHSFEGATFISGEQLVYVTNQGEEYSYAVVYDYKNEKVLNTLKIEGESISEIEWHKDSETLFAVTERGVEDRLYKWSSFSSDPELVPLPTDTIDQLTISKSGNVYVLGRSGTQPFNIYRQKQKDTWEQLTENRVLGVTQNDMVDPEVVSYKSFDGKEIEALWFQAKPENDEGYVVFWPHGGPQASERKSFRAMFQAILNRGYSIFAPNFRGSTGYGATFVKLVEQDWGEGPRLDCVEGIEWLFHSGKCDRDKLFVLGGSYGGYMTLLLAGRHPEYFKAVVDIFGVSNLFTFINSVPEHWKPIMERWVGDPERDKERLTKDSPITYLSTMTKPMLVVQGANDPRVVKEESDQIVDALKKQGTDVKYVVLNDEGHGFSKKKNEIKVYEEILDFLEKHK